MLKGKNKLLTYFPCQNKQVINLAVCIVDQLAIRNYDFPGTNMKNYVQNDPIFTRSPFYYWVFIVCPLNKANIVRFKYAIIN